MRQRITCFIGHLFHLTYAPMLDMFICKEKVNRCNGCAIQHPSHRQHSCLMMDSEDASLCYHNDVVEKIDLSLVMKTVKSICKAIGLIQTG